MSSSSSSPSVNVNGVHINGKVNHAQQNGEYLDPSKAFEYLEAYESRDGLSVEELMDSKKNGGLTYNDFILLPGT